MIVMLLRTLRIAPASLLALPCVSQAAEVKVQQVQVAVLLDASKEPLIATAACESGRNCAIISEPKLGITVGIELGQANGIDANTLTVACASPCSFHTGQARITFRGQETFNLFEGESPGVMHYLVQRPRKKIGEISVITVPSEPILRPPI